MKQDRIFWILPLFLIALGCRDNPPAAVKSSSIASRVKSSAVVKSSSTSSPETVVAKQQSPLADRSMLAESDAYKTAYSLLFDSRSRANKAIKLIMAENDIVDLGEKELNLLCWAYNELGDSDKQLEASRRLWELYPDGETSTNWICSSLWNKPAFSKDTSPIFEFVSAAIDRGQGNIRDLLTLKASVVIVAKDRNMTDAERRIAASDLLVQAYCAGPPSSGHFKQREFVVRDSPNFIDFESPFRDYFSSNERDVLKLRMKQARQKIDSVIQQTSSVAK